ncbi:hypothetical protein EVAR_99727_1 [Eumeta japonica]|uniref:Uncharacterized protein n=1 Tax=Eumeta variegata TaxID=151549 RepID=A0A4C1Z2W9_EUMVA|nr:hypothetical protein EVAR_99727_1 [Eumeta japonica]
MSDQTIEQTLMRMFKSSGGLTHGRGITESTLASWTLGMIRLQDRKSKVLSFSAMTSTIEVDKTRVVINPLLLFQRMCISRETVGDVKEYLKYELAPFPLSLFAEDGMRKGTKSSLFNAFTPVDRSSNISARSHFVIDGGFPLHKVIWDRNSSFKDITTKYVKYVQEHFGLSASIVLTVTQTTLILQEQSLKRLPHENISRPNLRYKQFAKAVTKVHLIYLHFLLHKTQLAFILSESTIRSSRGLVIIMISKTGAGKCGKLLMPVQNSKGPATLRWEICGSPLKTLPWSDTIFEAITYGNRSTAASPGVKANANKQNTRALRAEFGEFASRGDVVM